MVVAQTYPTSTMPRARIQTHLSLNCVLNRMHRFVEIAEIQHEFLGNPIPGILKSQNPLTSDIYTSSI
jgi:hypothetical protein